MLDFDKLDKTIHEKGRLAIMTLLASRTSWPFQDLKSELKMSDGNLVTHLRTLHQAGYVAVTHVGDGIAENDVVFLLGHDGRVEVWDLDTWTFSGGWLRRGIFRKCSFPSFGWFGPAQR